MQLLPIPGLALLGAGAGVSVVVQQVLVAGLRVSLGSAPWAALISYVGGTLTMVLIVVLHARALDIDGRGHEKLMAMLAAGVFGVIYIVLAILLIPKLGAATVVALIVVGQLLASLTFDHFGMYRGNVCLREVARLASTADIGREAAIACAEVEVGLGSKAFRRGIIWRSAGAAQAGALRGGRILRVEHPEVIPLLGH